MNILTWSLIGMVVGVISTAWQPHLSVRRLVLAMVIGLIGSVSGGVLGYVFYGTAFDGTDLSIFTIALAIACMTILSRRKISDYSIDLSQFGRAPFSTTETTVL